MLYADANKPIAFIQDQIEIPADLAIQNPVTFFSDRQV
jgi:hypothetical protein